MPLFQPGDWCGAYRIVGLLGVGDSAEIYEVLRPTGEDAALKILRHDPALAPTLRDRFAQEAESLSMIEHVNVVRYYDVGIARGRVFIVMELVRGLNLRQLLLREGGRLPVLRAVTIVRHACEGVAAAHRLRFVHRDLKPENVLVTRDDLAKVGDLGSVKLPGWGVETTQRQQIGSALYRAPEHLKGAPPDPKDDVYATGLLLRESITGVHPIAHGLTNVMQICMRRLTAVPPPLADEMPEVLGDLAHFLDRALAKDPAERCTMRQFADNLALVLDGLLAPRRAAARSLPLPDREPGLAQTLLDAPSWMRDRPVPEPANSTTRPARGGTIPMPAMSAPPSPTSAAARESGPRSEVRRVASVAGARGAHDDVEGASRAALVPPQSTRVTVEAPETVRSPRVTPAPPAPSRETPLVAGPAARASSTMPMSASLPEAAPRSRSRVVIVACVVLAGALAAVLVVLFLRPGTAAGPARTAAARPSASASAQPSHSSPPSVVPSASAPRHPAAARSAVPKPRPAPSRRGR